MATIPAWYINLCPANGSNAVNAGWKGNEYFPKPIPIEQMKEDE